MSNEYKVYKYTFPNGKIYIGTTKNSISERRSQGYQHNRELNRAAKQFGWKSVKTEILFDRLSRDDAFEKEEREIRRSNANDPNIGYNISFGGKSTYKGLTHTDECKKKMSKLLAGKKKSQSAIEKFKLAHAKERKAVIGTLNGNSEHFESMTYAAKIIGGYATNVGRACENQKPYKGYYWKFATEGGD